ncbi:MotA/TolQ/ExbB proton channel family protein [Gammaproteobacteria bacterium AS21]
MDHQLLPNVLATLSSEYFTIGKLHSLFVAGGIVFVALSLLGLFLFSLIVGRLWFRFFDYPKRLQQCKAAQDIKCLTVLTGSTQRSLQYSMGLIRTTIKVCPLLGLVGTVVGMIEIFDVIALNGVSSAQLMAAGVAKAILPTMAGMVLAISAMFMFAYIQRWALKQRRIISHLTLADDPRTPL